MENTTNDAPAVETSAQRRDRYFGYVISTVCIAFLGAAAYATVRRANTVSNVSAEATRLKLDRVIAENNAINARAGIDTALASAIKEGKHGDVAIELSQLRGDLLDYDTVHLNLPGSSPLQM